MSESPIAKLFQKYTNRYAEKVESLPVFRGEAVWRVQRSVLAQLLTALKREDSFHFLVDMVSVDNLGQTPRFEVMYELGQIRSADRLRIKVNVDELDPHLPTASRIWRGAEWLEREIYDMMGIRFDGHPDLKRILMWEGYPYHPLRKDFPLAGKPSEVAEVAFTRETPMDGGPFVTCPAEWTTGREPRKRG